MKNIYTGKHISKGTVLLILSILIPFLSFVSSCSSAGSSSESGEPELQKIGKAFLRNTPFDRDNKAPEAPFRTEEMKKRAAPTNQWYSSIMFTRWSEVLHALPLTFKATASGMEVGLPQKRIVPTERKDVEVFYPHVADLVVSPAGFKPEAANLSGYGDWNVEMEFGSGNDAMISKISHGSPFAYFELSSGNALFSIGKDLTAEVSGDDSRILKVVGDGKSYAAFAPSGAAWKKQSGAGDANSQQNKPTFGDSETFVLYDGRLDKKLSWGSYNPDGRITVKDSDDESVFFLDREDREDKYLKISKRDLNGNAFAVFGEEGGPERSDLSFWADQGELVLDIRVNSMGPDVEFLVKIDSGWPNVSDYTVEIPSTGEWFTARIPVAELVENGNRFNPGAYADMASVKNLIVLEPTGPMEVDVDNIRFEINKDLKSPEQGDWVLELPSGKGYFSVAALPDMKAETLKAFSESAYSFITDTRVKWNSDIDASAVRTEFSIEYKTMEGDSHDPVIGLYPHHYFRNQNLPSTELGSLNSIRGPIRLFKAAAFQTEYTYRGFVPYWAGLKDEDNADDLETWLSRDASRAHDMIIEIGWGAYWQGKGLQRISQLMNVAHAQGEDGIVEKLLDLMKTRMDEWFSAEDANWYFHYDSTLGTVVAYPEEYDAVQNMNDHHFHYGYWIRAAAEIAMQDPEWARQENYGAMIDLLVSDIATTERGKKEFPFLRNFDPYQGHSWASGLAISPDGNNQESSSEAINAWAGLILWGAVSGKPELVNLGMYLYSTEIQAAQHYWFDIHGLTLPEEYLNEEVSIVFGGKLSHTTWWTDEPRQIHGINLLPLTPSSIYLAESPEFIFRNMEALEKEMAIYRDRGKYANPEDIWQDIFAKYVALADPKAGKERWNDYGSFELGDTRSHAFHWLSFLNEFGVPDLTVTADTLMYSVFKNENGQKTYLVYNFSQDEKEVRFSDGFELNASPNALTVQEK